MNDILIPAARVRKELMILAGFFVLAELLNVFAIVWHGTPWGEVISQLPFVMFLTVLFYVLWAGFRFVWHLKSVIFNSGKNSGK